jgi:hypothetical protein
MLIVFATLAACHSNQSGGNGSSISAASLEPIDIDNALLPTDEKGLAVSGARNEWISFAVRIAHVARGAGAPNLHLSVTPAISPENFAAYQALPMAVNTNSAGYVRQTGMSAGTRQLPRALLPLACEDAVVDLSTLRDAAHPFDIKSKPGADDASIVWIDVHIPADAAPGEHTIECELTPPPTASGAQPAALASLRGTLHVFDFAIPQDRNLLMVSGLDWERLQALYPDAFEAITPRLMNRNDSRYAAAIGVLDKLEALASANRTELVIPRLQPTVKWSIAERPVVDWSDFDSVVAPWLNGDGLPEKQPLGYWPLPREDYLDNYDAASQRGYWESAATHFNRQDWLSHSAIGFSKRSAGRATALESIQLSMAARAVLDAHPLTRALLPLEDDQVQFESADNPLLLPTAMVNRLITLAPGLVFGLPTQAWPEELRRPEHWLNTDAQGLIPYVGAGTDQRDVRLWAWLAYLRKADLVQWTDGLPAQDDPMAEADVGKLTWFYPGSWFGVSDPVPSVQLKWLRRAEQDYEYLLLAEQRGMRTNAFLLARLLTRQVELQPAQAPDPEYGLLAGTVDEATWEQARQLLARSILVRSPEAGAGDKHAEEQLNLDIIRWQEPKERPYLLPRSAEWVWDDPNRSNGDNHAFLRLGVDVYNAGDNRPEDNLLQWTAAGEGWEFKPQPEVIGALRTYWIQRFLMTARVNLADITADSRKPVEINFVDGYTRAAYPAQVMLPVASSVHREGNLKIDGKLDDWSAEDLIHDGQLTKMIDRPSLQHWQLTASSAESRIYTGWSDDDFYVAFHTEGISAHQDFHRNFVDYQFRRAWGEDLCEVLVQPVYDDNTVGPVTYLACKPNGVCMVRRRLDPRKNLDPWREIDGTTVRYAANPREGLWDGEMAIPWKLLLNDSAAHPRLLRFNFIQHFQDSGESASWAGPIDFDQDDGFMGLLYLQQFSAPGLHS